MRLPRTLYTWCLLALPRSFRDQYAADMLETFLDKLAAHRERKRAHRARFVVRELLGVVTLALRERNRRHSALPPQRRDGGGSMRRYGQITLHELRYAIRVLWRAPGFTGPASLTLAMGIGATVAIFSVVRGVVLKPLPYPRADEIVVLDHAAPGINLERGLGLTSGIFGAYAERTDLFRSAAAFDGGPVNLLHEGVPEQVNVTRITPSSADVFNVPPLLGRWFTAGEGTRPGSPVVVLSYETWTESFESDPGVIGRVVRLQGTPAEVVGVMPREFRFPDRETQLWIPLPIDITRLGGFDLRAVARLQTGLTTSDVQRNLNAVIARLPERFPGSSATSVVNDARISSLVRTLHEDQTGHVQLTLWVLLASVSFIWLMACANVANLLLVRSEWRQRETAVRTALGATRMQLAAHILAESAVLALASTVAGLSVTWLSLHFLVRFGPTNIPRLEYVTLDAPVVAFGLALAAISSLLLCGIPVLNVAGARGINLRGSRNRHSSTLDTSHFRKLISAVQIAIAVLILVGSGLMLRTFHAMSRVDIGFTPENVLTFEIGLTSADYPTRSDAAAFQASLIEALNGMAGVDVAGSVSRCLPFGGWCGGDPLDVAGRMPEPGTIPPIVALRSATPGYLRAMQIPLIGGRWLEHRDESDQLDNVVISQTLATRYWPDEDPLGQRVRHGIRSPADSAWYTVVGVVADVPARSIREVETPIIYFPAVSRSSRGPSPHTMRMAVRTQLEPATLVPAVRDAVRSLDGRVPVANVQLLSHIVAEATATTTFVTTLLGIAAIMALLLGVVGVYSVISYSVARRHNEIGIRLALGASQTRVSRLVMRQALGLTAIGVVTGLAAAIALSRYLDSLLFEITHNDPVTYGSVVALLSAAALTAAYVPARRAARLDPVTALRT